MSETQDETTVEHDDHLVAPDVLGEQQFGQPRLADPRGAEHQGVADPVGEVHPDVGLGELDAVEGGIATDAGRAWRRAAQRFGKSGAEPGAQQVALLGETHLVQALGVALVPAEPPAEEETRGGPRNLLGAHDAAALVAQIRPVAQDMTIGGKCGGRTRRCCVCRGSTKRNSGGQRVTVSGSVCPERCFCFPSSISINY